MLKKLKQLLVDALIYGASGFLGQVLTFLLLPLYTLYLTKGDYGILQMLLYIPLFFPILAAAGMKSAVFQQYNRFPDDAQRSRMLSTGLLSVLLSCAGLLFVGVIAAGPLVRLLIGNANISDVLLRRLVELSLCTAGLATLGEIPNVILQSQRRIKTVATLNILQLLVTIFTTIWFVVHLEWGVMGVVLGSLLGQLVDTASGLVMTARSFAPSIDMKVWRTMAAYSLPFLPYRLLAVVMLFFGDYMLRVMLGLEQLGLYAVAAKFAVPIGFVVGAVQQAWTPIKFKIFAEDPDPASFFRSIFTYYTAGILYLWVGLSLWGPYLVTLMTAPEFHAAAALVWAVCLIRVMQGIYPMLATGIELSDDTRTVPLSSAAGLLTVVVAAPLLIHAFGAMGAALAQSLAWLAMGIALYFIAQRQIYIRYDLPTAFGLTILAFGFIVLGHWAHDVTLWLRLTLLVGLSLAFPVLVFLILMRSDSERHRMQIIWDKVTRFGGYASPKNLGGEGREL